jgi:hypothetical protein
MAAEPRQCRLPNAEPEPENPEPENPEPENPALNPVNPVNPANPRV